MTIEKIEDLLTSVGVSLCDDSRKILPGDVFVAVKGNSIDGHDHIDEAFEKGARAVVCEEGQIPKMHPREDDIAAVIDTRRTLGTLAGKKFRYPSNDLIVYGVTGTNGKSTTVSIIESVFSSMGVPCGMTGTVFNKTRGDILERSDMTTPGVLNLNRMLREMADSGKKAAAVEVSSHSLQQERVFGIGFDAAIFTNITPEHLDYHGDMASYLKAKARIFDNLKSGAVVVLNADDTMVRELAHGLKKEQVITFGFNESSGLYCGNIITRPYGSEFDVFYEGKNVGRVRSLLPGRHNIYNVLAATAAFLKNGFSPEDVIKGLEKARSVPGRLDKVTSRAPFSVFVDYAHTPDAIKSVLESLKTITKGKLFCVFGCGGNRDRSKRPVMGKIAADLCDSIILTDDNPRNEDPERILGEIEHGVPTGTNCCIIRDRSDAITEAVKRAGEGDTVLIAGKGHENYQIFADRTIHFDDKEEALDALKKMGY